MSILMIYLLISIITIIQFHILIQDQIILYANSVTSPDCGSVYCELIIIAFKTFFWMKLVVPN